jgi:hypothetical protein
MRFPPRLHKPGTLSVNRAWLCFSGNAALPGSGSLLGGRWVGYPQLLLALAGFGLSTWFSVCLLIWFARHWGAIRTAEIDPAEMLMEMWMPGRWIALGFVLFAAAWLWAMATGFSLLRAARLNQAAGPRPVKAIHAALPVPGDFQPSGKESADRRGLQ